MRRRRRRHIDRASISKPNELAAEPAIHELHPHTKEFPPPPHTLSFSPAPVSPMSPVDGHHSATVPITEYHELETPLEGMFPSMSKFDYGISHELPESGKHDAV